MKQTTILPAISLVILFLSASTVEADFVTFTDEVAFLAELSSPNLESFEGLVADNVPGAVTLFNVPSFTVSVQGATMGIFDTPDFFGTFATDGSNYIVTELGGFTRCLSRCRGR